jgi:hypothetical protein
MKGALLMFTPSLSLRAEALSLYHKAARLNLLISSGKVEKAEATRLVRRIFMQVLTVGMDLADVPSGGEGR